MTQVQTFEVEIRGIRPILMHNERLADPLDPFAKRLAALTVQKSKDHEAIALAEWEGGIYIEEDQVVLPSNMIDACLRDGAKATRRGKAIAAGVSVADPFVPLNYPGQLHWKKLYDVLNPSGFRVYVDRRGVRIKQNRVMRTRARFNEWSAKFTIERYDFAAVTGEHIKLALETGGMACGLGAYRPKFGLFTVEKFKKI